MKKIGIDRDATVIDTWRPKIFRRQPSSLNPKIKQVILDECVGQAPEVLAEIRRRLGGRTVDIIALSAEHPGMPDVLILEKMLNAHTLLVTQDCVLHNLAIGRGFHSLMRTPENGWSDRRLHHVTVRDKHLPVPARLETEGFIAPLTGDLLAIFQTLYSLWPERWHKHFRTKRRRIRAHFGSRENIGAVAITLAQRVTERGLLGGYKLKVDARHGVKALYPAGEGYFLETRGENHPLLATCWALSHLHALHLTGYPLTLFHLDADSLKRCATLVGCGHDVARDPFDRTATRLMAAASPKFEPCVKGFFFDQMNGKLTQLARVFSNEVVPTDMRAMVEALAAEKTALAVPDDVWIPPNN